jgi:hypothetical protein
VIARPGCPDCEGTGIIKTRCCGWRSQPDCCCAYDGGYAVEACGDCEAAWTADQAHDAAIEEAADAEQASAA